MALDVKGQALDLAVIGNCRTAALVDTGGRIVWWCFPRFDSDPVFSRLLAGNEEKGFCDVAMEGQTTTEAAYQRNTAIVETTIRDDAGNAVRITDFTPRFKRFERIFNPPQLFRRIEPIAGLPRIRIRVRPTFNYGQPFASRALGSNHIRYSGGVETLRLTTDAPLSYIAQETPFALIKPVTLILGPDEPFEAAVETASREFLERTRDYWLDWVRSLAIPLEYQSDIIRAAITLKLCSFEETGAIIAAHTTSIPEAPGTSRNWDYRYCWLRDAFFVIKALNRLGATQTMEELHPLHHQYRRRCRAAAAAGVRHRAHRAARGVAWRPIWRASRAWAPCASATRPPSRCSTMPTAASFSARRRCSSTSACRAWAMPRCSIASSRWACRRGASPSSPTRARGNTAAASASTPTPPPCAGWRAIGWPASRSAWALPTGPRTGASRPMRCATRSWRAPGTSGAA